MSLFDKILAARGLDGDLASDFLSPKYSNLHDPFLLPDMDKAVARLVLACDKAEQITIYGDYDIDGLTATAVLLDSLKSFGFENVDAFIPNRFVEGYGLTIDAIEKIAADGANLIITVDCGSLSHKEIERAGELGVDVIVTDHHNVADVQPSAVAVINPKRLLADNPEMYEGYLLKKLSEDGKTNSPNSTSHIPPSTLYPFLDLAGVGVAFKLVQALQIEFNKNPSTSSGLPFGQEKWLLDLVALGAVCDVVTLVDENRILVHYGLQVLAKTRRPGLRALMSVARVDPGAINARSLGFGLGPRMNAAGRLETARHALDMLLADDIKSAFEKAEQLDRMNIARRSDQDKIFKEAIIQAENYSNDSVLVVSGAGWNHGIVGIVAAKLLEKFKKPTFVLQEMGDDSKGSARSYGDFSAADAIKNSGDIVTKGGGHRLAAGVTLPTKNIDKFRRSVNEFYKSLKLINQPELLLPHADVESSFEDLNEGLVDLISQLEPFGNGNPQPVVKSSNLLVTNIRKMGADAQHIKLELKDASGLSVQMLAFNAPPEFFVEPGQKLDVWYHLDINEWNGKRAVEGRLLNLELK